MSREDATGPLGAPVLELPRIWKPQHSAAQFGFVFAFLHFLLGARMGSFLYYALTTRHWSTRRSWVSLLPHFHADKTLGMRVVETERIPKP